MHRFGRRESSNVDNRRYYSGGGIGGIDDVIIYCIIDDDSYSPISRVYNARCFTYDTST